MRFSAYEDVAMADSNFRGVVLYRASINLAGARQTGWQRITRQLDHAADDCRWQALR
jgi:hypothetical protein